MVVTPLRRVCSVTLITALLLVGFAATCSYTESDTLSITAGTGKQQYYKGEEIIVSGRLASNGTSIPGVLVAIEVQDPYTSPVISRTRETDTAGVYELSFKLASDAEEGTYTVYVSAGYMGETASNTTTYDYIASDLHDLTVRNVECSAASVYEGDIVRINVTVADEGTVSEIATVTALYSGNIMETQTGVALIPSEERVLTFLWNTTGAAGNHPISATIDAVPGEIDLADNSFLDGWVEVVANVVIPINGDNVTVQGNVTITDTIIQKNGLHISATGPSGSTGWINVTFPMINTTVIKVFINKEKLTPPPFPTTTTDGIHYFIYFEFTLSTHVIMIQYETLDLESVLVQPFKTSAGRNYPVHVNVTVRNNGDSEQLFNVTLYAGSTAVDHADNIPIGNGSLVTVSLTWDTTGWDMGNWTISAAVEPVLGETSNANNNATAADPVFLTLPGDVDADHDVGIFDIVKMAGVYGSQADDSEYNSNCDLDGDGDIDIFDIVIAAGHYGESW